MEQKGFEPSITTLRTGASRRTGKLFEGEKPAYRVIPRGVARWVSRISSTS